MCSFKQYVQAIGITRMTQYISLLQLKGGAGKSTITANLCGFFLDLGKTVLTVDADMPQGTLSAWAALATGNENHNHVSVKNVDELLEILQQAQGQFDIVLIDAPPRLADVMKAILYVSDLALLPLATTTPDIWATSDMQAMIEDVSKEKTINVRLAFNKFKATSRTHLMRQSAVEMLGFPQLETALSNYVAYEDVIGLGTHVLNHNHKKAKIQFTAFGNEVLEALEQGK